MYVVFVGWLPRWQAGCLSWQLMLAWQQRVRSMVLAASDAGPVTSRARARVVHRPVSCTHSRTHACSSCRLGCPLVFSLRAGGVAARGPAPSFSAASGAVPDDPRAGAFIVREPVSHTHARIHICSVDLFPLASLLSRLPQRITVSGCRVPRQARVPVCSLSGESHSHPHARFVRQVGSI